MRLSAETIIAREKVTRYLLVPQVRGDKSSFLGRIGYSLENADQLLADLRSQLLSLEAAPGKSNKFGQYFETPGALTGPNGVTVRVRAIWMAEHLSARTKFVTLLPDKTREK